MELEIVKKRFEGMTIKEISIELDCPKHKIAYIFDRFFRKKGIVKRVFIFGINSGKRKILVYTKKYIAKKKKSIKNKKKTIKKAKVNIKIKSPEEIERQKEKRRTLEREYRRTNYNFRVASNLRSRLRIALKHQKTAKKNKTLEYIGCSKEFLIEHLQGKFTKKMSWENYGKWHVDHIYPLSKFDLTIEEEIHKAMHYTNLQPLWAKDNRRKSNKYVPVEN